MARERQLQRRRLESDEEKNPRGEKKQKFFRLVMLLTFKKYGLWVIMKIYTAFLLGAAIKAMDEIWTEFERFQTCQEEYIASVGNTLSKNYNDAAHSLARSTVGRARCIASQFDLCKGLTESAKGVASIAKKGASAVTSILGKRRLLVDCSPKSFMDPVFGWAVPGGISFPELNMTISSNTGAIVDEIQDDISFLKDLAQWIQYGGLILAGFSILMIIFTALRYTIKNKRWKPSRVSYAMHFVTLMRVVLLYGVALLVIILQAYSTDKFCNVSIQSITMDAPDCAVDPGCEFDCGVNKMVFPNVCERCNIKLHWWWVEVFSWPNILFAVYIAFMIAVLVLERLETRWEKTLTVAVKKRHDDEKRRKQKKHERRKGRLMTDVTVDSSPVEVKEITENDGNVLDGPLDVEEGERDPAELKRQQTRYEQGVYVYPDISYTGGLR